MHACMLAAPLAKYGLLFCRGANWLKTYIYGIERMYPGSSGAIIMMITTTHAVATRHAHWQM